MGEGGGWYLLLLHLRAGGGSWVGGEGGGWSLPLLHLGAGGGYGMGLRVEAGLFFFSIWGRLRLCYEIVSPYFF